jgi:integrase/recombinase XerC
MVENYSRIAKLEGVTPHSLRHCFCKSLIDSGESIDRVAMLAGHENLNTTARYTRATAEDLQKTVERLAWE